MFSDLLIRSGLAEFLTSWNAAKVYVEHLTGASHNLLHLFVGLAAWLLIAAVTRRPLSSPIPLVLTLALAGINEAADLWAEIWPERARQNWELAKDLLLTIALPLLVFTVARLWPGLFGPRRRWRD